jgi:hypothetical protein
MMKRIAGLLLVTIAACLTAAASTASLVANRPFPFHTMLAPGAIKPSSVSQGKMDATIKYYYGVWKSTYLRNFGDGNFLGQAR